MKLYVVIRIPKSGSQSLRTMVRECLTESHVFRIPQLDLEDSKHLHLSEKFRAKRRIWSGRLRYGVFNEKSMWKKISREVADDDIISGHMVYGKPQFPHHELRYITLLRDPIERTISEYYYAREGYLNRPKYRRLYLKGHSEVAGNCSLPEFLQYLYDHKERYGNLTTRYVTGTQTHEDPFAFMRENYFHFGILERMDLFSNQLAQKLGSTPREIWINKTATRKAYKVTKSDLEILHALLNRDINLYNQMREYILIPTNGK